MSQYLNHHAFKELLEQVTESRIAVAAWSIRLQRFGQSQCIDGHTIAMVTTASKGLFEAKTALDELRIKFEQAEISERSQ